MKRFFRNAIRIFFFPLSSFYCLFLEKEEQKQAIENMEPVSGLTTIADGIWIYLLFAGVGGWIVLQFFSFINSFYVP